ncbi:FAD-dependent oxidoreductase [Cryobacterium tagatosivorans]|uniref:FAD-dependent oxidoreductase n=1 Tax=Cryobacterium tagatosivorans TaxID=1259199 RepID=A0A4R8UGE5_9MICO|nr:FAD-dependent oxidoreductase [Cryobacterium tagatosivorans]TFB52810.1 FAD-dependent oxidoreductase [Cryobacterium tagatosivorans]
MTLIDLTAPAARNPHLGRLPVAIIGAGPIGLAAAAHLHERGIDFIVYEAGDSIASSMAAWGHTRLFSPWKHLIDPAAWRLLTAAGWAEPEESSLPTGSELIAHYLAPLAAVDAIASRIHTGTTVTAVSREGMDRTRTVGRGSRAFVLRLAGPDGEITDVRAAAVIDASGTYLNPNSLGSNGLDPLGFPGVADLVSHALPDVLGADRRRFAGRHTAVVGAGHSAANTLIALARLAREEPGTAATWIIRNKAAVRVLGSADDELQARASIGAAVGRLAESGAISRLDGFEIVGLARDGDGVDIVGTRHGGLEHVRADLIVNATGFRPNLDMLREIRLSLDEIVEAPSALAPLIDPNLHSCGTVPPHGVAELTQPERDFFIVGMKSYGRAPTFLLATGYEQVRSIADELAGNRAAARQVQLVLPATGVCSTDAGGASSCC